MTSTATINSPLYSTSGHLDAGSYTQTASTIGGTDAGNYLLSTAYTTSTPNYTVNQLALTVASITSANSTYGNTVTPGAVTFTGGNVIGSDVVTSTATINSPLYSTSGHLDAGSYTQTASTIGGTDAGNYLLSTAYTTPTASYTVNQATISNVTGITANNKVYDGNTAATLVTGAAGFNGIVTGDVLNVATATGAFADRNVGTDKTVNVSGITLGGADVANYVLASNSATTTANITQLASVTWTGETSGNWSLASNWAGGAIPDGANVAAVIIPTGVTVTYDSGVVGTTTLSSLTSQGTLALSAGALTIGTGGFDY